MSTDHSLDRESFQKFLANAFAVQESGIDAQSLSAFVKVQKSLANGELGLDEAMSQAADQASQVACADGVAIALFEVDQLVYRAGSGSAASRIGQHVTAVLSASAGNGRREILRVENANTDSRIEADICRRFGAASLLILPIYRAHAVAGVIEIIFNHQHAFQDREVRTYRLLAGMVEEAMVRQSPPAPEKVPEALPVVVPQAVQPVAELQKAASNDRQVSFASLVSRFMQDRESSRTHETGKQVETAIRLAREACELWVRDTWTAVAAAVTPTVIPRLQKAAVIAGHVKRAVVADLQRNVAAASIVAALVIATWAAYAHRAETSLAGTAIMKSNGGPVGPSRTKPSASRSSDAALATGATRRTTGSISGFHRKRVGPNEVDYFANDVTMRVFTPKNRAQLTPHWSREVIIGDDVTVRYFASRPAQTTPVSAAAQAAERSLPVSK